MLNLANKKDKKGRVLKEGEDQLNDDRYRYRYTDTNGKRHAIYSWKLTTTDRLPAGKRQCKSLREKESDLQKDLADGINTYGAQITVNELVKRYLDTRTELSINTDKAYSVAFRCHIKPSTLGKRKIVDVKYLDVLDFYKNLRTDKNLAYSTIYNIHSILHPAFQLAVMDNLIRYNPCHNCLKSYKKPKTPRNALTLQQQEHLLEFLKDASTSFHFYYSFIYFLLNTGIRLGEAIGLTWDDIDFDNHMISVNHQLLYGRNKVDNKLNRGINAKRYCATATKSSIERFVPMSDALLMFLQKYYRDTAEVREKGNYVVDGYANFVFYSKRGNLLIPQTTTRTFKKIKICYNNAELKKSKAENREPILLDNFSPHILRHTFCTRMAEKGMDVRVLQKIMGHSDINLTISVYEHTNNDLLLNELNRIV